MLVKQRGLNALELHSGIISRELKAHGGSGVEGSVDALDAGIGEILCLAGGLRADGGAEAAKHAEAYALAILQVLDNLLFEGGNHGQTVVDGDGTLP